MHSLRDARLDSSTDREGVGLAVRVVHDGAWGFASGVDPHGRRGRAARRAGGRDRPGEPGAALGAGRARRRTGVLRRHLGVGLRDQPLRRQRGRPGRPADRTVRTAARRRRCRSRRRAACRWCSRTSSTPTRTARSTTQQRVRVAPEFTAVHVDRAEGAFFSMRTLAPAAGRGWEYLTGTGWDFDAELAALPELLREHVKAPSVEAGTLRPRHRPVQPLADHPRVDRARDRTRPRARLRGRLCRHELRDPGPARHAEVRQPGHERDRRPHRRARPGHDRLRRRRRR